MDHTILYLTVEIPVHSLELCCFSISLMHVKYLPPFSPPSPPPSLPPSLPLSTFLSCSYWSPVTSTCHCLYYSTWWVLVSPHVHSLPKHYWHVQVSHWLPQVRSKLLHVLLLSLVYYTLPSCKFPHLMELLLVRYNNLCLRLFVILQCLKRFYHSIDHWGIKLYYHTKFHI